MILGIVGAEAAKFTADTERKARTLIRSLLYTGKYAGTTSGACHLGGIDIWCREETHALGLPCREFPPKTRNWSGYSARNLEIAKLADEVICIAVRTLPSTFMCKKFPYCYHCQTSNHVKSGGCWTVKQALRLGKLGHTVVID